MKSTYHLIQTLVLVGLLSLASGCTITKSQVVLKHSALPTGPQLPHNVALVLGKELGDFQSAIQLVGETDKYPLGEAFKNYAQDVAGSLFQHVDVVTSEDQCAATDDLILIPKAVKSATSFSGLHWNSTLVVEWTVKTRADQNTIWLKTISINASEYMGNAFTRGQHLHKLFQKLFDDLSTKTSDEFRKATELH